jgi:Co/Zn/Cd efflux system component
VQAEYLHVLGDLLHSCTIVLTSILVYFWPELWFLDPGCTLFFAVIVVYTTKDTLLDAIHMLMEATPDELEP